MPKSVDMLKRVLIIMFVVAPMSWMSAGSARASALEDGAVVFVEGVVKEGIDSLTSESLVRDQRIKNFRTLFNDRFHVPAIARFALGRKDWKDASKEQQAEYMRLFEDLMVVSYVDRFAAYAGEALKIVKAIADDTSRATVYTEIVRPNAADAKPVSVLWRVGTNGKVYKVLDLVIEGVSLSVNYKRDFGSTIRRTGSLAGLLDELRAKTAQLREQAKNN